ncbi:hypothetical protein QQX98_004925 [Neonectria punicea]|uniref:NmrA-like domain-containing protein n=1 Tax=Neonectria punicea TaxID=979145 RepID=A0ABR1H7J6_9HYPO
MVKIKTVGVLGGTGGLGTYITKNLASSGLFDVTVFTRADSPSLPARVKSAPINYDDMDSLTESFRGQDAIVAVIPGHLAELQFKPIEAAIKAGVYRFIPSECGVDIRNPLVCKMPFMKTKQEIEQGLVDAAKEGKLTYTSIYGGAFVEWVLTYEELMPIGKRRFNIQNDGNIPFSITKMNDYAKAVVGALSQPEDTENEVLLVESYLPTQHQILALAKEVLPGDRQVEYVDMDKNAEIAEQKMFAGQFDIPVVDPMVFKIMFSPGYGGQIDETHNNLAGIARLTDNELKWIIKSFA